MDNGSGVITVLEAANQLKNFDSEYNIVIVFFSAEEYFRVGSRAFVSSLSIEEKKNAIGCINVDMVGEKDAGKIDIRTVTAEHNLLSATLRNSLDYRMDISHGGSSDEFSFYLGNIPAITLADSSPDPERSKEKDHIKYINPSELKNVANLICNFLIGFKVEDYTNLLNDKPKYESNLISKDLLKDSIFGTNKLSVPKGFILYDINSIFLDNGYASKTEYTYKNKSGQSFTITEQDSNFINPDTYSTFKFFKEDDLNNSRYLLTEDDNNLVKAKYILSGRFGEISGDISSKEAFNILKSYYENT